MKITPRTIALALFATFALSAPAQAQDKKADDLPDPEDFAGDEVEMPADDSVPVPLEGDTGAPSGAEEDPDAPTLIKSSTGETEQEARAAGYPMSVTQRPLTLAGGMAQLRYSAGIGGLTDKRAYHKREDDEVFFRAGGTLTAEYGVTSRIQLGLHYGTGTFGKYNDADDNAYETGKAVAIEVHYLLTDFAAVQLEIPMLLDPFEIGVTLGIPLKFRFGDKLAIFAGEDFITFRFTDMVPFVDDAVSNAAAEDSISRSGDQDDGDITVKGGVIYQLSPQLAFKGTIGIVAADFAETDAGAPLFGELIYVMSPKIDLAGRVGFANLAEPDTTFNLGVGIALRI